MTDDLASYRVVAERLQLGHQICQFHVRRWVGRTLKELKQAIERPRDFLLRLNDHWQSYCTFQFEPQIPWTNNATEQAIGRMKMRARTVRGYKSWEGMQSGLLLAGTCTR